MGQIVAIGGGDLGRGETLAIDRYIVSLCGKGNPRLLFLPTASRDSPGYIEAVRRVYGHLGCRVETLCLYEGVFERGEIRDRMLSADLIYVGGGDTAGMMAVWAAHGVDHCLRAAYRRGVVLSGLSAGSICYFEAGYSDSEFHRPAVRLPQYGWVRGLGLIPLLHCPHFDEPERAGFAACMRGQRRAGVALENGVALVWEHGRGHIIKSDPRKKAYRFDCARGRVRQQELPVGEWV
ncbi:MAG: peptidase E [Eubacteriales bacterium]